MDNKKSNIWLVIALIIFIVLLIILCSYLVSGKLNNNSNNNSNKNLNNNSNQIENNVENINENSNPSDKKSEISVVDFYFDSIAIVSDGSVYVNVYGSTTQFDNLFGEGTFQTLMSTRNNYKEYSFDNFEYILDDNSSFIGMKLNTSNVKKVYSYTSGQTLSSNYGLILLNKDKTLSIISLYSLINGKTDVKNISGLSNIENIITENNGGMFTYAVNQNGEKINLSSYIPNDYKLF